MNTNNNTEDLLHNLPDYITGKIADEGTKFRIEEEIIRNAGFRQEYELLKKTYSSIKDLQFSEPPAHFFTNLIPRLNMRIESRESKFSFENIFKLTNLFKYALPAVSVVLLIIIITFTNKSNKNENMFIQSDNTITDIMQEKVDSTVTNKEVIENTAVEEKEVIENNTENTIQVNREKNTKQTNKNNTGINQSSVNIEEFFSEEDDSDNDEDYMYENEFSKLSGKEQTDIINKLSN